MAVRYVAADARVVRVIGMGELWSAGHLAREPGLRAFLCVVEIAALRAVYGQAAGGVD